MPEDSYLPQAKNQIKKLLFTFVILILGTIVSTCYLTEISPKLALAAQSAQKHNVKCVYDITHEYLPNLVGFYQFYNVLLALFFVPVALNYGKYNFRQLFFDFSWLFGTILAFRTLTIIATVPTATVYNVKRDFGGWIQRLIVGHEQDLCFSGHTAIAAMIVLIMFKHNIIKNRTLWISAVIGFGLFSAMSRSHFTGDVIWAIVTVFLFYDFNFCQSGVKNLIFGGCRS